MKMSEFFTESNGRLSSTRLLMILVLLLLGFDWIYSVLIAGSYTISWEKVALITSVFGLKGVQKYMENENDDTYPPVDSDYYNEDKNESTRSNRRNKKKTY